MISLLESRSSNAFDDAPVTLLDAFSPPLGPTRPSRVGASSELKVSVQYGSVARSKAPLPTVRSTVCDA